MSRNQRFFLMNLPYITGGLIMFFLMTTDLGFFVDILVVIFVSASMALVWEMLWDKWTSTKEKQS